jgi:spermidine synthase
VSSDAARATRPVLRFVGLAALTVLLVLHELVLRQTRVYLAPLGQRDEALALSALGGLAGAWFATRARHPREGLAWSFSSLSLVCPLSVASFTWALEAPGLWDVVRLVLPTLGAALTAAAAVYLVRSLSTAWSTLGLVRDLLGPGRVLVGLLALIGGVSLGARLGLLRYALALGALSAFVAFRADWANAYLWGRWPRWSGMRAFLALGSTALAALLLHQAGRFVPLESLEAHDATLIHASGTGRDRVQVTSAQGAFALFVGGSLRWSGLDATRYADALVLPTTTLAGAPERCLVLGGGDGLVLRRLLSVPSVTHVTLVTPEVSLYRKSERLVPLRQWTRGAASDERVELVDSEALPWLDTLAPETTEFDVILVDVPDPTDAVAAKNYTRFFYERLRTLLAPGGALSVQAAPLFRAPHVFRSVAATLRAAGFALRPYEAELPALGLWGFLLGVPADDARVESPSGRAPWPELEPGAPVRPLAADTPFDGWASEAPNRLNDLHILRLLEEVRRAEVDDDAPL